MIKKIKYYFKKKIRQSFTFNSLYKKMEKSQYFSQKELEELQNKKLQKLIKHCYKNVPYYREMFDNLKFKPSDIQTKEDLKKLPYLDKYIIRANQDKLIAKNRFKFLCNVGQTSGTTGTPLNLYRDYHSINFENIFLWRHYRNVGDFGLKRLTLRGQIIVPIEQQNPPFWEYNPANKELLMSSYHLSTKTAGIYINKIKEFKPEVIFAYPSSIYLLASFLGNLNEKYPLKAIFTSSEKLKDEQRELIEKTFNCKIYDWYGQAERVAAIGQCEKGTYHIIEDYSIVETIDTENGIELVGTGLDNYIMPLIRYKTGDIVELKNEKCKCGRNFRVVSTIQGRETNYYYATNDGIKITAFDHFTRGINGIIESQIIQEKIGELIIKVVTNGNFSVKDKEQLIKNIIEHTSPDMKVIIKEVDLITRGPNGKFQAVINKVIGENNEK